MKKQLWIISLLTALVCFALLLVGCSSNKSEKLLSDVLDNKITFISENGSATYLKDYKIGIGTLSSPIDAIPSQYIYVDMDRDGEKELVVNVSDKYGYYLVFHYSGQEVYGFEFNERSLLSLKTDGSFMASNGAASNSYCKIAFDDNSYTIIYEAVKDGMAGKFELDGENVSIEALNEFINDWNLKTNVEWTDIEESPETTNDDTDDSKEKINLNNYISVRFSGKNLAGYASVSFDKEKFLLDNINNISFNKDNLQVYRELYGNTDKSAANAILSYVFVSLNKNSKLSNGDAVEIVWNFDEEKIKTYFEWNYVCTSQSFTVAGLTEADTFDPFEKVEVSFSGNAPYAKASVYNYGYVYNGSYTLSQSENLKNGDEIKVIYNCEDKATMIAKYGKYPSSYEKTYKVSGLNTYVQAIDEISSEAYDKLIENAASKIWVLGYGTYKDAKYCGNYFYSAKEQPAHGVYFLQWCGTPVGNAVCFVFERPERIDSSTDTKTVYTVIAIENLLIDESGNLIYNKHEMWEMSKKYASHNELAEAFVGVFDEIMNCANNVKFD